MKKSLHYIIIIIGSLFVSYSINGINTVSYYNIINFRPENIDSNFKLIITNLFYHKIIIQVVFFILLFTALITYYILTKKQESHNKYIVINYLNSINNYRTKNIQLKEKVDISKAFSTELHPKLHFLNKKIINLETQIENKQIQFRLKSLNLSVHNLILLNRIIHKSNA